MICTINSSYFPKQHFPVCLSKEKEVRNEYLNVISENYRVQPSNAGIKSLRAVLHAEIFYWGF
jgi:hypothetical protein